MAKVINRRFVPVGVGIAAGTFIGTYLDKKLSEQTSIVGTLSQEIGGALVMVTGAYLMSKSKYADVGLALGGTGLGLIARSLAGRALRHYGPDKAKSVE